MALKDLTIDQNALQEELIESLVASYIRYDVSQRVVIFLPEKVQELTIPQKIVVYLLALKGWQYFDNSENVLQDAPPKAIAEAIMENGSTTRSNLQILLKKGLILKNSTKYSIPSIAIHKIQNYLHGKEK